MTEPRSGDRPPGPATWILALAAVLAVTGVFRDTTEPAVEPVHAKVTPATPVQLVVPALDLRAPVVPIEVTSEGILYPPEDVDRVGWWKRSAKPGNEHGQTVLTGHTVTDGRGVMDRLGDLAAGARVRVRTREATLRYEVTRTVVYSRQKLTDRASQLFGQGRDEPRLVLITCTDWDGDVYRSNIVVFAEPIRGAAK